MTGSLAKLTAGQGYTYLTRQVAAFDGTDRGHRALSDYYSEKGERPGVWVGKGLSGIEGVAAGDRVSEDQMRNLFGLGLHPNADQIAETVTAELDAFGVAPGELDRAVDKATRLGNPYRNYEADESMVTALRDAYRQWNTQRDLPPGAPIPADVRAGIRSRVGAKLFVAEHGRAPLDERELTGFVTRGLRPQTSSVAGFDLTFSPVKSVSALWAVAPKPVADTIARCHEQAVADAIQVAEQRYAYTRRGDGGLRHEDITGLVAAQFLHRDSRAGDPDLHTHVAVSNKVQSAVDGKWLALDGATLYRGMVDISEAYNTALETRLNEQLGLRFAARKTHAREGGKPVREVVGVPAELLERWSSRTRAVDVRAAELAAAFQADHHRAPTPKERRELRQQANLETRQDKHEPRSEAEQRAVWRDQATGALGEDGIQQMLDRVHQQTGRRTHRVSDEAAELIAGQVITTVEQAHARWRTTHVSAEVRRQVRARDITGDSIEATHQRILDMVLHHPDVVRVQRRETFTIPEALRDRAGRSVYDNPYAELYVTKRLLRAEAEIVAAAGMCDRPRLDVAQVDRALALSALGGRELNPGQAQLVRDLGTSGARVQLALAPAGSGKTTAMAVLANAWRDAGGTVIGLGPSATSASELAQAIGSPSDTIASLTWALTNGRPVPGWAERIGPDTMLVIDEAGMAGTLDLHAVIGYVTGRGGQVRLIGDDQQLASIAAGGVLRDIAATAGAVSLSELVRFVDPSEAAATQALRGGDRQVIGWMIDHQRVHVDPEGDSLGALFTDWVTDREQGRESLMLAFRHDDVAELNRRARDHRLATTEGARGRGVGREVRLADGLAASSGDLVISIDNDRTNHITATDWVKNGDRWTIQAVQNDGGLVVKHQGSGRVTTLSADYVQAHVRLGYAVTIHAAQGVTVDVARTYLTGAETRQLAYVAMSRGRAGNHAYLGAGSDADPHQSVTLAQTHPTTAVEVLEQIIGRDGAQVSATTEMRLAGDPGLLLARHAGMYRDALHTAAHRHVTTNNPDWADTLARTADTLLPGLSSMPAWDSLANRLAYAQTAGADPVQLLTQAVGAGGLDDASDPAAVLTSRVDRAMAGLVDGQPPLPWLAPIPEQLTTGEFGVFLAQLDQQVRADAAQVGERARTLPGADMPTWAHPLLSDRDLVARVAVWRAAQQVPDEDLVPQGTRPATGAARQWQRRYAADIDALLGAPGDLWAGLLAERAPAVLTDPYWPVVARRLDTAHHGGTPIAQLLTTALDKGPLPDQYPAAALWYRLVPDLGPAVLATPEANRLRPDWTAHLATILGDDRAHAIITAPAWASLVAAVHDTHTDPATILDTAVALTDLDHTPAEALAQILTHRITTLHDTVDVEEAPMPDPATEEPSPDDLAALHAGDTIPAHHPVTVAWPHEPSDHDIPPLDDELPPDPADLMPVDAVDPAGISSVNAAGLVRVDAVDAGGVDAGVVVVPDAELGRLHDTDSDVEPDPGPAPDLEPPADADQIHPGATSRGRIVELTEQAAAFYTGQYTGSSAAGYITTRFGTDLTDRDDVTIGYAPGRGSLTQHLLAAGATPDELIDAGLSAWRRGGILRDVFNDRVVLGLRDTHGDLVGFTGRAAPGATNVPKYLNTPTTQAFTKGEVLFGLHEHAQQIRDGALPVITEGAFDAIAVTLAGGGDTIGVAPCGTALTTAQVHTLLDAGASTVLDAADTDTAGRAAMRRHHDLYVAAGIQAHQLILHTPAGQPDVKDPAELYQRDLGHTLGQCLSLGVDSPTVAAQIISTTVFEDAPRIRDTMFVAWRTANHLAANIIAPLPVEQWEEHIRLAADLIAHTRPSPGYYHDLVDQILDTTATAATQWATTPPKDPAMTTPTTPQVDPALLARMQALTDRNQQAVANLTNPAATWAAAEQANLTLTERMERMRQHLHQTEQDLAQRWEDVTNRMPVDEGTIDQGRGMTE